MTVIWFVWKMKSGNNMNNTSSSELSTTAIDETNRYGRLLTTPIAPTGNLLSEWSEVLIEDKPDFNKNLVEKRKPIICQNQLCTQGHHTKTKKYVTWSWRLFKRKQIFAFLAVLLIVWHVTWNDPDERIPVVHYSHVPGMKEMPTEANELTTVGANVSQKMSELMSLRDNSITIRAVEKHPKIEIPAMRFVGDIEVFTTTASKTRKLVNSDASAMVANSYASAIAPVNSIANILKNDTYKSSHLTRSSNSHTFLINAQNTLSTNIDNITTNIISPPSGYLVWSDQCKMPNLDPYLPEVMTFFTREKYKPCSITKPLSSVSYSETLLSYELSINDNAISSYSKSGILNCCYQSIERNSTGTKADSQVSLLECISFNKNVKLHSNIYNILVKCYVKKKLVYINGHPMMPERKEIRDRLNNWKLKDGKSQQRPPSVLMIGIDSISRVNLIRAMPKTAQYLYDNEWFEMSGYNKIDDNTFPNLMAVLTGRNKTNAFHKCPPTILGGLDNCSFIWNTFRDHGYVTAYGEDEADINTFNYLKVGFERPPVDYYLRPFLLSAEKHLPVKLKSNLIYCLGYQHSADFVYEYAIELAARYKYDPFFGLFWTNSFSHNAISDCTAMDEKMMNYLKRFNDLGTLNNTIVIFFSDHGMRYGPTRRTLSGHLEERLPFMFLWLPHYLKQLHPEFVNALSVNKNRLTNPYDLHMTLKHLLGISHRVENKQLLGPAEDCSRCQTLLEPVPHNRSCEDIAIADHWCTCIPYQSIYKNSKTAQKLAKATVEHINKYVANFHNGSVASMCKPLKFHYVDNAYRAQQFIRSTNYNRSTSFETYRIIFYTKPNNALFEVTLRYCEPTDTIEITGEVSRLNAYVSDSYCMEDGAVKKYCSCRKKKML